MTITVLKQGLQTTLQAGPRTGLRHLGVPASGAADPLSLALANRLVGNRWDAPALECTLLGPALRFDTKCAFALTGCTADVSLNARKMPFHETLVADAGDELRIGAAQKGARCYVAVAGGFDADIVLGSSSTYLAGGLGGIEGRALEQGDVLQFERQTCEVLRTPGEFRLPISTSWALRASPSFETQLLDESSLHTLFASNWTVGRRADRIGVQLEGEVLAVSSDGRMPSAAVFPGTVQCPENGTPYVLLADAGTVGGYPRIAQVVRADRHLLGQLRPGDHVRFLERDAAGAAAELRSKLDYWANWLDDIEQII